MSKQKSPQRILFFYSSILTICAVIVLGSILSSPSEPGSAVLFGFSLPRIALALVMTVALIFFLLLTIKAARDRAWSENTLEGWFGTSSISRITIWLGGLSFGLGWIGVFLPAYRLGKFAAYWIRLQPVMIFILLAGFATLILLYIQRRVSPIIDQSNSKIIRTGMILFLACFLVLVVMLVSGFGVRSPDDFWYGAGVPILFPQLIVAIAGGMLFLEVEKKWNIKRFDLAIFTFVFAVTAFFWAREPLLKGFSFVSYPPNNELYPLYDAALFDAASQFPLIGQKIAYAGYFFERPLYLVFLVYLHALFGQDYQILMAVQAGIFAIFPALIYLIGRSLNLRSVGFAAALIALFRGINGIAASTLIDLANPKMMLTDFPAAIGVALVILAVCEWLNQPGKKWQYALWIGGTLGFTLMLRTNALMLLALVPLYASLRFPKARWNWLVQSSLILLAVIAITLPWELRNRSLGGQMYGQIVAKVKAVIDQRYTAPEDSSQQLPVTQSLLVLSTLYQGNNPVQASSTCDSVACFVPNHFLHNIVTSILILPTSPVMDDLRYSVKEGYPYWRPKWDGTLSLPALLCFILNLLFITLGIASAWKQGRVTALAPLAIFIFYDLSNAFARTSGGRYIVPMDWILTIYFLLGVFQVTGWAAKTINIPWAIVAKNPELDMTPVKFSPSALSKAVVTLSILVGFGYLLPLSENLYVEKYQSFDAREALAKNVPALEAAGLSPSSIDSFLRNRNSTLVVGHALYPRHLLSNDNTPVFYSSVPVGFPRTTFSLIGLDGKQNIVLPGGVPEYLPHNSNVIVIGCKEKDYIDTLALIVLDESGVVYVRSPESELKCPLTQPVCNNNSVCK